MQGSIKGLAALFLIIVVMNVAITMVTFAAFMSGHNAQAYTLIVQSTLLWFAASRIRPAVAIEVRSKWNPYAVYTGLGLGALALQIPQRLCWAPLVNPPVPGGVTPDFATWAVNAAWWIIAGIFATMLVFYWDKQVVANKAVTA